MCEGNYSFKNGVIEELSLPWVRSVPGFQLRPLSGAALFRVPLYFSDGLPPGLCLRSPFALGYLTYCGSSLHYHSWFNSPLQLKKLRVVSWVLCCLSIKYLFSQNVSPFFPTPIRHVLTQSESPHLWSVISKGGLSEQSQFFGMNLIRVV